MKQERLQDALASQRRLGRQLNEVMDLTRQLSEAVARDDQTSIRLVLEMRSDPLREAADIRKKQLEQLNSSPGAASDRLRALLNGAPAAAEEEKPLCEQVAANRRALEQIRQMDERLSSRLARDRSVYTRT